VGKLSTMGQPTRPTQPSIPPGSVNELLNPFNYMDYGSSRLKLRAAVWLQGKVRERGRRLLRWLYACSVCDTEHHYSSSMRLVEPYECCAFTFAFTLKKKVSASHHSPACIHLHKLC